MINAPPCYLTCAYNNREPSLTLVIQRTRGVFLTISIKLFGDWAIIDDIVFRSRAPVSFDLFSQYLNCSETGKNPCFISFYILVNFPLHVTYDKIILAKIPPILYQSENSLLGEAKKLLSCTPRGHYY